MSDRDRVFERINNVCLVILAAVALTVVLIYTRDILVPFVFSIFIYAMLAPQLRWLQRKLKVPRSVAVSITTLVFLTSVTILILAMISSAEEVVRDADQYRERILILVDWLNQLAARFQIPLDTESLRAEFRQLPVMGWAQKATGGLMSFLGNTTLVIIFVLFLVIGDEQAKGKSPIIEEIQAKVSSYVSMKSLISLATGVLVFVVLATLQIELALMFAILTFLLNFIPNIGSFIATLLPLPVVLLQYGLGWQFFFILGVCGILQFILGNIVEPKLMGESMDLHPVTVLIFLMFWGLVWGVPGMFLSVPITAILKITLARIETTKGFAELLAGRLDRLG